MKPMPVSAIDCATWSAVSMMLAPERFQHVGAAGLRRHRAAAVLGDARAGRGRDEHRRGRDVERVRRIAAGADDVDQVLAIREPRPVSRIRASPAPPQRSRRSSPSSRAARR
jgi:hypothetical protein